MPPCHGGGRGFESRPVRKEHSKGALLLFMPYYVYIIQSMIDQSYYKGYSEHPKLRLQQHNNGESEFTSGRMPWNLVYVESFVDKSQALKREKSLKKYDRKRLERLVASPLNIIEKYLSDVN